jgi:hypothetical protein
VPVETCTVDGKQGYRYGATGKCYTHDGSDTGKARAKKRAVQQAIAIGGGKAPQDLTDRDLADAATKTCKQCQLAKPIARFPEDDRTTDGHSNVCVNCRFGSDHADREFAGTTSKSWDGSASRFTDEQYKRSCLIDRGGDASVKERCSLPVLEPDGTLNTNALGAAAAALAGGRGGLKNVSAEQKASAARKLRGYYSKASMDPPDSLKNMGERSFADELETVDLTGVELLSTGGPYFGTGSPDEGDHFDEKYLEELAANAEALKAEVQAPIKIGHSKGQRLLKNSGLFVDEMPAAGWVENQRVAGGKLLGDLKKVPKKIADLINIGAFRKRSVELSKIKSQTDDGKEYEVVSALALLGAKAPAVRTLNDIVTQWYADATEEPDEHLEETVRLLLADVENDTGARTVDYAEGDIVWDSENGAGDWQQDLAAALNQGVGPATNGMSEMPNPYYVQDIDQINRKAVVCDRRSNTTWVVSFAINSDGDPVPAPQEEWTLAEQAWVQAANDSAAKSAGEYAQHELILGDTSRQMAETATKPEVTELSDEQVEPLAETFGIEESDAAKRREAVVTKLGEFVPKPKQEPKVEAPKPEVKTEPEGVVLSAEEKEKLMADATAAREFVQKAQSARIEANLRACARMGKIDPKDFKRYRDFMEKDYDLAVDTLAKLPVNRTLLVAYGSDENGEQDSGEEIYRAYAERTGVPLREKGAA